MDFRIPDIWAWALGLTLFLIVCLLLAIGFWAGRFL